MILWRGPSLIDGSPIVAIATGGSHNSKTGDMLQTWILHTGISPRDAIQAGADAAICGDCKLRGDGTGKDRACYVRVDFAPASVWRAYKRGAYGRATASVDVARLGAGRLVRLGSYGDPAAVPAQVWSDLVSESAGHTGYTHQWRTALDLRPLCMASVDTLAEAREARELGWRTFRVSTGAADHGRRLPAEANCPASAESGAEWTCAECLSCGGTTSRKGARSLGITIRGHGGVAAMAAIRKLTPAHAGLLEVTQL